MSIGVMLGWLVSVLVVTGFWTVITHDKPIPVCPKCIGDVTEYGWCPTCQAKTTNPTKD
jgi:hypothetical protein